MDIRIDFSKQNVRHVNIGLYLTVTKAIKAALVYEKFTQDVHISVTFTDNEGIRALNREYRDKDSATDVLSFPLFDYEGTSEEPPVDEWIGILGDIVLSLEQAEKQAEEFGHSFEREVAFLCVHSMLHLLGYDHLDEGEQKKQMRAREEAILSELGITRE